jgi:capsid assembly protease
MTDLSDDILLGRADDAATTWAVRPELMPAIAELMRRGRTMSPNEARERLAVAPVQAARRSSARVAGGAVAILSLRGLITPRGSLLSLLFGGGGGGLEGFRAMFREALGSDEIGAILLDIDSPGGLIDLVPETAAEIREARGTKPIVAIANTMAASAAYWIATQADEVVVTQSGDVGSVGVFATHEDWSKFDEQLGVKTTLISAGKYKTEGNPFEPLSDTARATIQKMVDEAYDMFVADVAAGRAVNEQAVREGYGEGRVVTAANAVSLGMADRVATIEETIGVLARGESPSGTAAEGGGDELEAAAVHVRISVVELEADPIPKHDTAVVDESWDGPGEEAKISNDAGKDVLRRMYAWVDSDKDEDTKAAYKFPHHKVTDGKPGAANLNGCRNVLSRLPQSNIPEADREGVRAHLQHHLDAQQGSSSSAAEADGAECSRVLDVLLAR